MASLDDDDILYALGLRLTALIHKSREKEPLTADEQKELNEWLNSTPSNKDVFEALNDREQVAAEVTTLLQYDEDAAVTAIFKTLQRTPPSLIIKRKLMIRRWSVAASLLILVSVAAWFLLQRDKPSLPVDNHSHKTIATRTGHQDHVVLPDGSEVWLNTASSISYPPAFTGSTRPVVVEGEAWFKVAKDKSKPFIVTAGAMKVEVTGTEFNVMAYADEDAIRTTLVEGSVNISGHVLKPGEQAALERNSGLVKIEKPNLDEVTGWRKGQFSFHGTGMEAIMRQVARWYNVKIEYRGSVSGIGFTGNIERKENLKDLLAILSDTRKVHFEIRDDNTIVVIPGV